MADLIAVLCYRMSISGKKSGSSRHDLKMRPDRKKNGRIDMKLVVDLILLLRI